MKTLYRSAEIHLVKINDEKFYYGDGKTINAFGINAAQFLRFNPYMDDVSEDDVGIPQKIVDYISKHEQG
jgi:hypothetical protein